jgi:AcrR family transcriptional regulator
MKQNHSNPKQRILHATIGLLMERGGVDEVTIRDIARRAEVGIGLVNYHFQTKENLINQSVRRFIGEKAIAAWDENPDTQGMTPSDTVKAMLQSAAGFLADYPVISRISILFDLTSPSQQDNSMQTIHGLCPALGVALEQAYDRSVPEQEVLKAAWELVAIIHESFLRAGVLLDETGVDYFNAASRDAYIGQLVDRLLKPGS